MKKINKMSKSEQILYHLEQAKKQNIHTLHVGAFAYLIYGAYIPLYCKRVSNILHKLKLAGKIRSKGHGNYSLQTSTK